LPFVVEFQRTFPDIRVRLQFTDRFVNLLEEHVAVAAFGVALATQWTAAALGYQLRLGAPWFLMFGTPIYYPWRLFQWWYFYNAYAPEIFLRGGAIAACSGIASASAAVAASVWRARQSRLVTTYGSARWATHDEIAKAGLLNPAGVFLVATIPITYGTAGLTTSWPLPQHALAKAWGSSCRPSSLGRVPL
jgi:type IV secretory pathway TraG/TraD family ATPase VirD4